MEEQGKEYKSETGKTVQVRKRSESTSLKEVREYKSETGHRVNKPETVHKVHAVQNNAAPGIEGTVIHEQLNMEKQVKEKKPETVHRVRYVLYTLYTSTAAQGAN
jgi:tellurite resistance-related uncharacterized protein